MGSHDDILDRDGQVKPEMANDLLVEVISGKLLFESCGEMYASHTPNNTETEQGRIVYARRLRLCRQRGLPGQDALREAALKSGQFDPEEVKQKANLLKMLGSNASARQKTTDAIQKATLDAEMERMRGKIHQLEIKEQEVLCNSAESVAEDTRRDFFVACCTMTGELLDRQVWKTWEEYQNCTNIGLMTDSRGAFLRVSIGLPSSIIRALARCHDWRTRWRGAKDSNAPVFDGPSGGWDSNKLSLVYWSEFYDAIANHPEAPSDQVINDDAALQDWLNAQLAQREKEKAGRRPRGQNAALTYRDGSGRRRQMTQIGSSTIEVNTPYKIRS